MTPGAVELVRLALVVSSTEGAPGEVPLRFADDDAQSVIAMLQEVGGVRPGDAWHVPDATTATLTQALGRVTVRAAEIEAAGGSVSLFVYYAGHSAADGLHLGDERLAFDALKTAARVVPATERVFVLDTCQAGQIARTRGATLVEVSDAPRGFEPPSDEAWLASSGPEQSSYEVDDRRGALFTHFFTSGARGAADADGDHRVTLREVFAFTQRHTSAAAAGIGGVQEPRWAGALGETVLTELADSRTGLRVVGPVPAPLLVVSRRDGHVLAEIPAGAGATVALPPGSYQVTTLGDALEVADVDIRDGWALWTPSEALSPALRVWTRGGLVDARPVELSGGYRATIGATPGRPDGHGAWLSGSRALGHGHHVDVTGSFTRVPFETDWWGGVDAGWDVRVGWRYDLTEGVVRTGPGLAGGGGSLTQIAGRAEHPVWGAWYGDAEAEAVTVGVLGAEVGWSARVGSGAVGLAAWVGGGPLWLGGVVTPAASARVGLVVRP